MNELECLLRCSGLDKILSSRRSRRQFGSPQRELRAGWAFGGAREASGRNAANRVRAARCAGSFLDARNPQHTLWATNVSLASPAARRSINVSLAAAKLFVAGKKTGPRATPADDCRHQRAYVFLRAGFAGLKPDASTEGHCPCRHCCRHNFSISMASSIGGRPISMSRRPEKTLPYTTPSGSW